MLSSASSSISLIYTTVASLKDAKQLAKLAVERKLAFCVNIIPKGFSVYGENNKTVCLKEYFLFFKTSLSLKGELHEWLGTAHPYNCPILLQADATVNPSYADILASYLSS